MLSVWISFHKSLFRSCLRTYRWWVLCSTFIKKGELCYHPAHPFYTPADACIRLAVLLVTEGDRFKYPAMIANLSAF